ncbi:RBBP6 ligase, partial [Eurystomus gularis]|nr:RBBP6 ligase [Eurystomus gularis]
KKDTVAKPAKASQEKVDTDREKSPRMEPPVKKAKEELPKADSVKTSQKDEKALGTPRKVHPKVAKDHPEARPAKEEKAKKDHPKEAKSEKPSNKEDKSKKPAEKSKPSDAKPEKRKRKADEKVDKEHETTSAKASKPEAAESKTSPKGKAEPDGEKGERTPEKEKSAFLNNPAKKIKLNRETGKKIVSGENVPPGKEPAEKAEPSSSKVKQEKVKGKARRKVTAADGSSSTLVDYTSTSSTGGSPIKKTEEKPDTKRTVIKTMEEYNNDITAPAEDVIIMIQVPQSKWDKDDFESEEEDVKSTQVPTSIGKPASVIKNVSAKLPNPVKHSEKETEPVEKTLKAAKETSYESSQHDVKSSKSSMSNEKGKTKDRDHPLSDKDTSEKRKTSAQPEKDHLERAAEQGNGKNVSQSSKDSRSSEKHDPGRGSAAKDFTPNRDKKSDHDGSRDHSSSKRREEKSEVARRKESPSRTRDSTAVPKSKPRDERAELSKKGAGDAKRSSYSPPRERKQPEHKAAHDSKRAAEEHKPLDKTAGKEKEKHVPEVKSSKEKEPAGSKPPVKQESPDVKIEKEKKEETGQNDKSVVKAKPQASSSSRLSSDLTRETDEAAFVPDYNESDSESNVSAKDEEAAGKTPKEPKEKAVEKAKEEAAAPAPAEQPEASRSQSQSSPSVSRSRSQSPSESQTRSHSSSASSGESQDSKKK